MIRQMRYYIAVVEAGSFSEAAEVCHISRSAMLVIFLIQGISGLMMAKHIRLFNVTGANWSRQAHLAGAYWCFVLCGIHAGLHMTGLFRKWQKIGFITESCRIDRNEVDKRSMKDF